MKPTKSIYILLSLFLIFSCDDKNSVEPLVCDEGLTDIEGVCTFVCDEGVTECYYQGDLDVLQDIIDVNESLSGQEPLEIGNQIWTDGRLEWLYLGVNQLTTLPESIGNLSSLEWLNLVSTQLTTLPESIGNLSSLEILNLNSTQLTTLPESIGNLSSLVRLELGGNQLTTLPESIGNLSSLEVLSLGINQLTTLPESIGNLSSLERLILSTNQLTTLPESIGNLSSLRLLTLEYNQLISLPESIGNLSSLTTLWLYHNQLTTLPESFCNLSIDWNGIDENGGNYFSIIDNKLCSSISNCIEGYVVEQLCEDDNCESGFMDNGICINQSDLNVLQQIIDLNESMSGLQPIDLSYHWTNGRLTGLELSYNEITILPESLGSLDNLTYLYIRYNQLTSLPESICNLPSDCYISVYNNQLCEEYHYDCIDNWGEQDCEE